MVVVNHALFFSDLALQAKQGNLLGEYQLVVLDEAHTVEQVASDHFGQSVSSSTVRVPAPRPVQRPHGPRRAGADRGQGRHRRRQPGRQRLREILPALAAGGAPAVAANGRIRRPDIVPNDLSPALLELAELLKGLHRDVKARGPAIRADPTGAAGGELAAKVERLIALAEPSHAYWLTRRQLAAGRRW